MLIRVPNGDYKSRQPVPIPAHNAQDLQELRICLQNEAKTRQDAWRQLPGSTKRFAVERASSRHSLLVHQPKDIVGNIAEFLNVLEHRDFSWTCSRFHHMNLLGRLHCDYPSLRTPGQKLLAEALHSACRAEKNLQLLVVGNTFHIYDRDQLLHQIILSAKPTGNTISIRGKMLWKQLQQYPSSLQSFLNDMKPGPALSKPKARVKRTKVERELFNMFG